MSLASAPPALRATHDLACRRGERLLFSGLGLEVHSGQVVWLRGSNGRGKTSLLRILTGLAHAESGEVQRSGQPIRTARDAHVQGAAYVAHANALKDDLSAMEALAFLAQLHGQQADEAALVAALTTLGIASRRAAPVRTLSQGQRRRVALARLALAPRKPLWLLDEPFDALDTEGCERVDRLLSEHARSGGAVVLTSHLALTLRDPLPIELMLQSDNKKLAA
jgi:heme exporter protein A